MKKIYVALLILATVLFVLMLSSCACKHEYGEWTETQAPTCKDYGTSERVCTKCGHVDPKMLSPNAPHIFGEWETAQKPTCMAFGEKKRTCTVCGYEEKRGTPIDINAHSFGDWTITKEPTDTEDGQRVRFCELCKKPENEIIPSLD